MNPTAESEEFNADPFAADIFASARDTASPDGEKNSEQTSETETFGKAGNPVLWSAHLPGFSRPAARWDELLRRLPSFFFDALPRRLTGSLSQHIDLPGEKPIKLSIFRRREINSAAEFEAEKCLWLTVETRSDDGKIFFAIDDAFAAWLIDAALAVETATTNNNGSPDFGGRDFSPSELAVLEFFALNLAHEANGVLQSAQFKFRRLSRKIPRALAQIFESESFSVLALDCEISSASGAMPPTNVEIFLTPQSLQTFQRNESGRHSLSVRQPRLPLYIKGARARLFCGEARLTFGDLAALEIGDAVLLENQRFSLSGGRITGRGEIFLGDGANAKLIGALFFPRRKDARGNETFAETGSNVNNKTTVSAINFDGSPRFTIESIAEIESTATFSDESMTEKNDNSTASNLPLDDTAAASENAVEEASGLAVENLIVSLRVELEARRLSLLEVANLRENQTLELGISPTDEVNLLIDDRVVGRGELVSVDERLGVRITKLMR